MTWLLKIQRLCVHKGGPKPRTYGRYELIIGGITRQTGFMCEPIGPSSSYTKKVRIAPGLYRAQIHLGTMYKTIGYDTINPSQLNNMPAIKLEDRGTRDLILIHPAHEPTLYLSSVGCLNPTSPIGENQVMSFQDSRARTIDLVNSLKDFAPNAFINPFQDKIIDGAIITIEEKTA